MAKYKGTVPITGPISPTDTEAIYATHLEDFGQGGYRSVPTIVDRDLILPLRRKEGMKVYVIENETEYRLVGGIENTNWIEIIYSGSGGSGNPGDPGSSGECNYRIIETLAELEAIPMEDREKGLSIYIKETDQEYRLMKGIENINWTLISDPVVIMTNGTTVVTNPDGTSTVINNNELVTNNYYSSEIGCLNRSFLIDSIMDVLDLNIGNYEDENGIPVTSETDVKIFSIEILKDTNWIGEYILFKGSTALEPDKESKIYISTTINGVVDSWCLSDYLNLPSAIPMVSEFKGSQLNWYGYLKFNTYGQKNITFWQENDSVRSYTINKTLFIFAPNFAILDSGINIPNDIIELPGTPFVSKTFDIFMAEASVLTISLARINVTAKGIDTKNYNIIPGTSSVFTSDGIYTLNLDTVRSSIIDGTYALVVTGKDSGITIPPYFFGPFVINLL